MKPGPVDVYLIRCEEPGHWYVGITTDFARRAQEHAEGQGGALFTRRHGVHTMRLLGTVDTAAEALALERTVTLAIGGAPDVTVAGAGWNRQEGYQGAADGRLTRAPHPQGTPVASPSRRPPGPVKAAKLDLVPTPAGPALAVVKLPVLRATPHVPVYCERHDGPPVYRLEDSTCCECSDGGDRCCYCGMWGGEPPGAA